MEAASKEYPKASLETLPNDLRRNLLSMLDLHQLSTLTHASPIYHAQYLQDRRYLLSSSLKRTLGTAGVDAFAAHDYKAPVKDDNDCVSAYLERYEGNMQQANCTLDNNISLEEIISMTYFHLVFVVPLEELFVSSMLSGLAEEAENGDVGSVHSRALTSPEKMRVTRTVYRYQLLCKITDPEIFTEHDQQVENARTLFNTLEPWEVEELLTLFEWVKDQYGKVLENIRWDLHPESPRFEDQSRPPTPDGAFELDDLYQVSLYQEGLTLRGVPLLHTVLCNIKDHEELVSIMQKNIKTSYIPIDAEMGLLSDLEQQCRYRDDPTERDRLQASGAVLQFRGDGEPRAPPLAWTTIWGGTYSNLCGWYTSVNLRRCGYVFWDATRLEFDGGLQVIERLKEDICDPRDEWIEWY